MNNQPTTLTAEEEIELIRLMGKVGTSFSGELFAAVAAKFVLTAIETVFLRNQGGKIQVLLTQRDANDPTPALRGKWHSPGTMLRASDETYEDAFQRVLDRELGGVHITSEPQLVSPLFHHYERGPENGLIFVLEVVEEEQPKVGKFVDVDDLPSDLIPHHYLLIEIAVDYFRRNNI